MKQVNEKSEGEILWSGLISHFRHNARPDDGLVVALWKTQENQNSLLNVLGCEFSKDGTPSDVLLFHMNNGLTAALHHFDVEQIFNILTTIKSRYAKLSKLFPKSIYSSAPSWFTRSW